MSFLSRRMAFRTPHFICLLAPDAHLRTCHRHHHHHHSLHLVRFRDPMCIQSNWVLPSMKAMFDVDMLQIPSFETSSGSSTVVRPLTYVGAVGPPPKFIRAGWKPRFWVTTERFLSFHNSCSGDKMIKSNIRLVISIAKNYQGAGMNLQDLVQEGCRGLVKGAEKFDAAKVFKFSTYAHWWIKQAVCKSLSDQSRTIRLPFHMVDASYRVREARKQLYSENGRYPNDEEIAKATGLLMKRLAAVMLTPKAPKSLDQKIGINQDLKPVEVIADPDAETAEEMLMKQFMKQDLEKVLNSLCPREMQVVRWRFGMEDGRMKTLQEIGELMAVSRERVGKLSCVLSESSRIRRELSICSST